MESDTNYRGEHHRLNQRIGHVLRVQRPQQMVAPATPTGNQKQDVYPLVSTDRPSTIPGQRALNTRYADGNQGTGQSWATEEVMIQPPHRQNRRRRCPESRS